MIKLKLTSVAAAFQAVLKHYQQLKKEVGSQSRYKIIEIRRADNGDYIADIQVTGKNTNFTATPKEILSEDSLMEGFSPVAIRTLTYFATLEHHQFPDKKLVKQKYCPKTNQVVFMIQDQLDNMESKTIEEIAADENIINRLPQQDAHMLGYIKGSNSVLEEAKARRALKK